MEEVRLDAAALPPAPRSEDKPLDAPVPKPADAVASWLGPPGTASPNSRDDIASYDVGIDANQRRKGNRQPWTKEQIAALEKAVADIGESCGRGKWKMIAARVPGRNDSQCRQRWEDSVKPGRKEGTWSPDEDEALRAAVEKTKGVHWRRWTIVAKDMKQRTAKQCEYRWKNHLAPRAETPEQLPPRSGLDVMMSAVETLRGAKPKALELPRRLPRDSTFHSFLLAPKTPDRPMMIAPHPVQSSTFATPLQSSALLAFGDTGQSSRLMADEAARMKNDLIDALDAAKAALLRATNAAQCQTELFDLTVKCVSALHGDLSSNLARVKAQLASAIPAPQPVAPRAMGPSIVRMESNNLSPRSASDGSPELSN
ncbi:hypothetical protein ACHHYP_07740 [Achlya hypogyna]|uniref:Myb-like DNA-binding protein n=1 Tax=Achlya hypogyna TaxID=1202772 RepID=A0A1V9ZM50_ACHHY|nr:hypothetical protein ACHHYP_07740 [Achlya hypogyna]